MYHKVSEKTMRACKGITLIVSLDVIKHFDHGEQNKGIVSLLNWPASNIHTVYMQRKNLESC